MEHTLAQHIAQRYVLRETYPQPNVRSSTVHQDVGCSAYVKHIHGQRRRHDSVNQVHLVPVQQEDLRSKKRVLLLLPIFLSPTHMTFAFPPTKLLLLFVAFPACSVANPMGLFVSVTGLLDNETGAVTPYGAATAAALDM